MSKSPGRTCQKTPGCSGIVRGGVCKRCGSGKQKRRSSSTARGYGYKWQKLRDVYIKENPLCVDPFSRHGDRVVVAEEIDHKVPLSSGGSNEWGNLQSLCRECHRIKTLGESFGNNVRYSRLSCRAFVVWGPPAGGKTTFVRERKKWGDVVVDVDALYSAISGLDWYEKPSQLLPVVLAARDAIIRRLSSDNAVGTAWIITADPNRDRIDRLVHDLGAELVEIIPTRNQTISQLQADTRRRGDGSEWIKLIDKWYSSAMVVEG